MPMDSGVCMYSMCVQHQKCVCTCLDVSARGELKVIIEKMKTHVLPNNWSRCQVSDFENVLELCKMLLLGIGKRRGAGDCLCYFYNFL